MPASRTCAACGAALSPDVRWCGRCAEPVREFTPRPPLHHGDHSGRPSHETRPAGHWSRWEKSTTTFGPAGRTSITLVVVLVVASGLLSPNIAVIAEIIVAGILLRDVWKPGWVVPPVPERRPEEREDLGALLPVEGLRVPKPEAPLERAPEEVAAEARAHHVRLAVIGLAALGVVEILAHGSDVVRFVAICAITMGAVYAFIAKWAN